MFKHFTKKIAYIVVVLLLHTLSVADNSSTIIYEDAQDNKTTGWQVYDTTPAGAVIKNVYDSDKKSKVIALKGSGLANGFILGGYCKSRTSWRNQLQKYISWKMKTNEKYAIFVSIDTINGHRYLYYTERDTDEGLRDTYIHHGLGSTSKNGKWHTFTRDLEADLKKFESNNSIIAVEGILIRGSLRVDDIALHTFPNKREGIEAKNTTYWKGIFHILNRFSYGANGPLLEDVISIGGINAWFNEQLEHTTNVNKLIYKENNNIAQIKLDNYFGTVQRMEFQYPLVRPMHANRQIQAVMATFWSNHFNTNRVYLYERVKVEDKFFTHALGNFKDLLKISAKSAAMSAYLDGRSNKVGKLNENYAREIMELHTLGVENYYNCEKKGTYDPKKGYCLSDILALARIFTGWSYKGKARESARYDIYTRQSIKHLKERAQKEEKYQDIYNKCAVMIDRTNSDYCYYNINSAYKTYKFYLSNHDTKKKLFLGQNITNNGQDEGEKAIDKLATSPMTAKHICTKLAKKFVSDQPNQTTIEQCSATFMSHSNADNQIAEVLRVLKDSSEFQNSISKKTKDIQEYILSLARLLELDATKYRGDEIKEYGYGIGYRCYSAGQGFYRSIPPTGWTEDSLQWAKPNNVMKKMREAHNLIYHHKIGREKMLEFFKGKGIQNSDDFIEYVLPIMSAGNYKNKDIKVAKKILCGSNKRCKLVDSKILELLEYLAVSAEFNVQ